METATKTETKIETVGHLIDGKEVFDHQRQQGAYNPSTGELVRQVELASSNTVEQAIAAAQAALPEWKKTPPIKRARIFYQFKILLEQHADAICQLIGEEHGKIKHDALGELQRGIENVEFVCGIPQLLKSEYTKNVSPGIDAWSEHHALGVVAGITPFNFPAMVPLWMFPLAIACGNTFVLKPSERVPRVALYLAKLLEKAGLPPGVLNIVNGDKQAVDILLTDPRVKAVSFVGSTPIAEYIYTTASAHGKRCQALGGAKNHAIIMPDADMENTANQLIGAAFGSSGERCMALSVVVAIGDATADQLVERLKEKIKPLKVGAFHDSSNDFGPLISHEHKQKVLGYINGAIKQGATLAFDGREPQVLEHDNGFYLGATLLDCVTPDMKSYQEEIFGPVLQIVRVKTMDEAMQLINNHEYGNGTCIFTRDGEAARYFSEHVEVGMVGINVPLPVPVAYHSFGGWKRSLFGDLHAYGPDGVKFYTKRKAITQRWPSSDVREGISFAFPS
ncbi:MAG: CoA-acylating methylmalonate-semialdehyde dehydrogenase [Legionellaceae bacterium]|nr:CoA-acylating methylmalonate-semialdehyde dehydrogenase [Legionellaceae bacterium]